MTQQAVNSLMDTPMTPNAQNDWRQRTASVLLRHQQQIAALNALVLQLQAQIAAISPPANAIIFIGS